VLKLVDPSRQWLVVAERWHIGQIIDDQGITEFPSIYFYQAYEKSPSVRYEGSFNARAISDWCKKQVAELDSIKERQFEDMEDI
jgi:hypothetical protein